MALLASMDIGSLLSMQNGFPPRKSADLMGIGACHLLSTLNHASSWISCCGGKIEFLNLMEAQYDEMELCMCDLLSRITYNDHKKRQKITSCS
jgi:hypothetical protein